jgi:hypothetical protein
MIIETVSNPEHETEIKLKNLPPGTVFQFDNGTADRLKPGPTMLKLCGEKAILLTYSTGSESFEIADGSMDYRKIIKIWGKLVGLKVQL